MFAANRASRRKKAVSAIKVLRFSTFLLLFSIEKKIGYRYIETRSAFFRTTVRWRNEEGFLKSFGNLRLE